VSTIGRSMGLLEIEVHEIRGKCPVYKVGDKMIIAGPKILLDQTDAVCIHALSTLLHYVVALDEGADPVKLGLTKPEQKEFAYMRCVDPGEPYTSGGAVIFRCLRTNHEK
jgi:uncharacterized repeat protein (TIGR04076 family)